MSQIIIISFGFLHGEPPEDTHLTLDLRRHFRDPHVNPALRHLTAYDPQVVDAVLNTPGVRPLVEATAAAVLAYASGPSADGNDIVVGIGCAGGRHRAATVATELRDRLETAGLGVTLIHRDLHRPVVER